MSVFLCGFAVLEVADENLHVRFFDAAGRQRSAAFKVTSNSEPAASE